MVHLEANITYCPVKHVNVPSKPAEYQSNLPGTNSTSKHRSDLPRTHPTLHSTQQPRSHTLQPNLILQKYTISCTFTFEVLRSLPSTMFTHHGLYHASRITSIYHASRITSIYHASQVRVSFRLPSTRAQRASSFFFLQSSSRRRGRIQLVLPCPGIGLESLKA